MTTHSCGTHEVHLVTTSMGITKVPAHVQLSTRLKKSPAMFDLERYTSSAGLDSERSASSPLWFTDLGASKGSSTPQSPKVRKLSRKSRPGARAEEKPELIALLIEYSTYLYLDFHWHDKVKRAQQGHLLTWWPHKTDVCSVEVDEEGEEDEGLLVQAT